MRWYDIVAGDNALAQGDFLCRCPVIVPLDTLRPPEKSKHGPPKAVQEVDASVREYNAVILTQDRDIPINGIRGFASAFRHNYYIL